MIPSGSGSRRLSFTPGIASYGHGSPRAFSVNRALARPEPAVVKNLLIRVDFCNLLPIGEDYHFCFTTECGNQDDVKISLTG